MFADRIENLKLYIPYNEKIKVVCDYLAKTDIHALEVGKYDIGEGVRVVVNAFTPKTREAARWETHKKYIDLQYLIDGEEFIGVAPLSTMKKDVEARTEGDIYFYEGETVKLPIGGGRFMVLFPEDAHAPCIAAGGSKPVHKVVIKIAVE